MAALQQVAERVVVQSDREKLSYMRRKAHEAARKPEIVELATRLVRPFRADDWRGRVNAVYRFVRDGIRYQRDPGRREQLADPRVPLELTGVGDCDDKIAAFVALLGAVGIEADFWPLWKHEQSDDPELAHVQGGARWPGSERLPGARSGAEVLDGPPGAGWIVSDPTIAGAELGVDPRTLPKNPDTGAAPLS